MKVRVDFSKMPKYTRPEQYRYRREMRGWYDNFDYNPEDVKEMNDLWGGDGWGDDPGFWDSFR